MNKVKKLLKFVTKGQNFSGASVAIILYTLIVAMFFKGNIILILFALLLWLVLAAWIIVFIIYSICSLYKKERFVLYLQMLLTFLIVSPLLLIVFLRETPSIDSVKTFYAIGVSIGANYVIDGAFKRAEIGLTSLQKDSLTKKATLTKILFNTVYISEYSSFILVNFFEDKKNDIKPELLNTILKPFSEWDSWVKVLILTIIIFIILISVTFDIERAVKEEVLQETPNELTKVKQKLSEEIEQINQLQDSLKKDGLTERVKEIQDSLENEKREVDRLFDLLNKDNILAELEKIKYQKQDERKKLDKDVE